MFGDNLNNIYKELGCYQFPGIHYNSSEPRHFTPTSSPPHPTPPHPTPPTPIVPAVRMPSTRSRHNGVLRARRCLDRRLLARPNRPHRRIRLRRRQSRRRYKSARQPDRVRRADGVPPRTPFGAPRPGGQQVDLRGRRVVVSERGVTSLGPVRQSAHRSARRLVAHGRVGFPVVGRQPFGGVATRRRRRFAGTRFRGRRRRRPQFQFHRVVGQRVQLRLPFELDNGRKG